MKEDQKDVRTWVEIDKKAVRENVREFRRFVGKKTKLTAVVKSNAYGHGLVPFSKLVASEAIDRIAVDSILEGLRLREAGVSLPLLVLGFTLPHMSPLAAKHNIALTVSSFDFFSHIPKLSKQLSVHVKVDTGMHRQGFFLSEIPELLKRMAKNKNIVVEGAYTHFADAKNPSFPDNSKNQAEEFKKSVSIFEDFHLKPLYHASATSATLLFPQYHFDMVRVGVGLYGLWPSEETRRACHESISLRPALSWKSVVGEVKEGNAGSRIGYNYTETFRMKTRFAIIPIGYWHGFPRALSSVGEVLIRGKRARVLGRVSMDMIAVDVSNIKGVKMLDTVTLLGADGKDRVRAEEVATLCDTINYEVVTRINSRIRRLYL